MPVSDQEARALAFLASSMRPHGARRWDEPGIVAAIGKVKHLALADVVLAVARAADDRTLETPAPIGNVRSPCWRERNTDRPAEPKLYDAQRTCGICGYSEADCRARWENDHEFEAVTAARGRGLPKDQVHDVVEELKDRALRRDTNATKPTEYKETP